MQIELGFEEIAAIRELYDSYIDNDQSCCPESLEVIKNLIEGLEETIGW